MQLKFVLCMIKYKIKHKIVNCEKIESVMSHDLYPLPLSQTVTLSQTPSPLERVILYGRPPSISTKTGIKWCDSEMLKYFLRFLSASVSKFPNWRDARTCQSYTDDVVQQEVTGQSTHTCPTAEPMDSTAINLLTARAWIAGTIYIYRLLLKHIQNIWEHFLQLK